MPKNLPAKGQFLVIFGQKLSVRCAQAPHFPHLAGHFWPKMTKNTPEVGRKMAKMAKNHPNPYQNDPPKGPKWPKAEKRPGSHLGPFRP